mmetsp:Transcript_22890/g.52817  ORF Transcript_22890/g.52817 Transcript_22890/m.52817 type:complete len:374 (-) Transcript_22890:346-1467(-)
MAVEDGEDDEPSGGVDSGEDSGEASPSQQRAQRAPGARRRRKAPKRERVLQRAQAEVERAAARLRKQLGDLRYMQEAHAAAVAVQHAAGGTGAPSAGAAAGDDGEDSGAAGGKGGRCPICYEDRSEVESWCITACMHSGCWDCMLSCAEQRGKCPLCNKLMTRMHLHCVGTPAPEASADAAAAAFGDAPFDVAEATREFGTKVTALLCEACRVCAQGERLLIFSGWTRLLRIADEALRAHGVPTASLAGGGAAKQEALRRFKLGPAGGGACVLLIPLFGGSSGAGGGGAAGLTLTEARTAILLEPQLQPGIERQAAGRICRIGQKQTTTCIRLIVTDTVEPNILRWQEHRLANGANGAQKLSLSDFMQLIDGA